MIYVRYVYMYETYKMYEMYETYELCKTYEYETYVLKKYLYFFHFTVHVHVPGHINILI